jgi:galactokinase
MAEYNRVSAEGRAGGAARRAQFVRECEGLVPAAAAAIAAGDAVTLGKAAAESQAMAETVLRNQVPETTALVRALLEAGAFAASSFGAGFGGAVWGVIGAYAHDSFDLIARVCGVNSRWSDFMEPSRGMATG